MAQSVEIERGNVERLLGLFKVKVEAMSGSTAVNYKKSLACLAKFSAGQDSSSEIASDLFLENWLVSMFQRGLTAKTSLHYFDIIAGLYGSLAKDGIVQCSDAFKKIKARVKPLTVRLWKHIITEESFLRLVNVTKTSYRHSGENSVIADILLFSLLNPGMKLVDVACVRREDLPMYSDKSREVAGRYLDNKRKYLFPLDQTKKTSRQLNVYLCQKVAQLFYSRNIAIVGNMQDTISSYWAYAALSCGATAADVVSALGAVPPGLPILGLCSQSPDSTAKQSDLVSKVADLFVADPYNWYAMRLRAGVKIDRVEKRLADMDSRTCVAEMFYPCNEFARKKNRKLVREMKPILPEIVFFKSRVTDVQPLIAAIGDLVWCYKTGGAYATISHGEMERFQKAIGKFSPDFEVGPVGTVRLRPGDKVVVIGGTFAGREGEIRSEAYDECGTVYRVMLWGDNNNIEWRVSDPRLIEKK